MVESNEKPEENGVGAGAIVAVSEVTSAARSLPTPNLGGVKTVKSHTKAIGVILPPPDLRAIIDKTAQFVGRNGVDFEKRILNNEKNNVKFNFLIDTDPYHAYYKQKVGEVSGEGKPAGEAAPEKQQQQQQLEEVVAQADVKPVAAPKLEKPDDPLYMVNVPPSIRVLDLDVIKLTAQFAAKNGESFVQGLKTREQHNPLFHFLKPTHSLFHFFQQLRGAYQNVMMPPKGSLERLDRDAKDRDEVLQRCLARLEWERAKDKEADEAAAAAEKERTEMQMIDWHSFVVVETIDFEDAEDEELPPPMSLKEVVNLTSALPYMDEQEEEPEGAVEGQAAVPMDSEEQALLAEAQQAETGAAAPGAAAAEAKGTAGTVQVEVGEEGEEEEDLRILPAGSGAAAARGKRAHDPSKFVVSPITGELIPIAEMAEHMRISLIDPRWREQREAMLSKIRDTTKAGDDEITRNLVGLARTRPDIFGSTQEEVTAAVKTTMKEKMMSGTDRSVAWDGQTTGGAALENQMKAVAEQRQEQEAASGKPPEPAMPKPILGPAPSRPPATPALTPLPPPPSTNPSSTPSPAPTPLPPPPRLGPMPPAPTALPPPPAPAPAPMAAPVPRPAPVPPALAPVPQPMYRPPSGGAGPYPGPAVPSLAPVPPVRPAPAPAPAPMLARTAAPMEPMAKRQKLDGFVLEDEEEFLQRFPGQSTVQVQVPDVEGNAAANGQLMQLEVVSLHTTAAELKEKLAGLLELPANKQKLERPGVGIMRNDYSLAHYNVGPDITLALGLRERGGRKK